MQTRYAKSTGTFYPQEISYKNLPTDIQFVDSIDYDRVMARPAGSSFSFDSLGVLAIIEAPAVNQNNTINAQIAAIEAATMLPRIAREEIIHNGERWAAVDATASNTVAAVLLANAGYQRVKAVDDKIKALRALLK